MTSLAALQSRIKALQKEIEPASKTWVLVLEQGQGIPPEQRAQIGPRDTVVIREVPKGFLI